MARRLKVRDLGTSLKTSATSDRVDLGVSFIPSVFTITGWFKIVGTSFELFDSRGADGNGIRLENNSNNRLRFYNSSGNASSSNFVYVNNKWFFLTVTQDASGNVVIYNNATSAGSISPGVHTEGSNNLYLANRAAFDRGGWGCFDEVRIFNRVLTATEIADLYYDGTLPSDSATSQIAAYDMNGTSSTTLSDITGNGHDGTITGATRSPDVPMRRRFSNQARTKSIDFSGATDVVDFDSTDFLGTGSLTISGWIFPRSGGGTNGRVISNNKLDMRMNTNIIQLASDKSTYASSGFLPYKQWTHFVATRDASTNKTTFYLNGQLSGTVNQSSGTPAAGTLNPSIGNLSGTRNFDGHISDLRVHNRILTQAEINDLYFDGISPSGTLVRQFTFDNTLADATGQGVDGVATGTTYSDDVRFKARSTASNRLAVRDSGTALVFDGSTNVVSNTNTPPDLSAGASGAFLMKASRLSGSQAPFEFKRSGSQRMVCRLIGNKIDSGFYNGTSYTRRNSDTNLQPNKWYLIVFVWDGSNFQLYINAQAQSRSDTNPSSSGTVGYFVGARGDGADFFQGTIDRPLAWNVALTQAEVSDLYYNNIIPQTNKLILSWPFNEGSGTTALDTSGNGNNGTITGATYTTDVFMKSRTVV